MDARLSLLQRVSIFEGVDPTALRELSACLTPVRYDKDAVIVGQNDPGDAMYVVATGRVRVVLRGKDAREVILTSFRSGEFFGEMSLLDGQPRSAHVLASEATEVLRLTREDFVRHLRQHPDTGLRVMAELSMRLRRADEVIGNLALLDVFARIGRALIELARKDGTATDEGILVKPRPTQQELAAMVGTTRETVSRVLSLLQRRGYLSLQAKSLVLSHGFADQLPTSDRDAS